MTTFNGTIGDDTLTAIAGNDTYQLGAGNDTIYFNASVDALGVLTWNNGLDTVISTDGGLLAPNYDKIILNFSKDYVYGRKVGNNMELSIYAHVQNGDSDPGTVDQVGKITLVNAFSATPADHISRVEDANGFYFEAISAPVADIYGHTAIYKTYTPKTGDLQYVEWYTDINFNDVKQVKQFTDGHALVSYFDSNATLPWSHIDLTYSNYGTSSQTLVKTEQYNDNGTLDIALVGTSGNDSLLGGAGNDVLSGGAGNDTLFGGAGNDKLDGGAGADTLTGGAGNDTLNGGVTLDYFWGTDANFTSYGYATAGVNINMSGITGKGSTGSGTASGDASVGVDTLMNINLIQGSNYNDTITGSSALYFEQIEGGAGNDVLNGGAITDTLNGDNDNRVTYQNAAGAGVTVDLLVGTAVGMAGSNVGSDTLVNFDQVRGSNFNDTLLGSNRTDLTEQFEGRAGNDYIDGRGGFDIVRYNSATTQVIVNLATGLATGAMGNDTLVGIEGVRGGSGNDILTGGNALNGTTVNDGLLEVFRGEEGNDTIDGGQGYDRVDYTSSTAGVVVVLNDTLDGSASDGFGGTDVLRHIEGVRGSAFNDVLTGSNSAAFESFEGREGNDTINGNGGVDRVDYQNSRAGVTVNLVSGLASDGYGGTDTLSNIENVRGSRDFNDLIIGSSANNKLEGLGGNDTLNGGAGADNMIGGDGSDTYYVDNIGDVVSETNAVVSTGGTDLVLSYLSAYTLGANVENGRILSSGTASLTGNALANLLYAGAGNNVLDGGLGTDTASYQYATAGVTVSLASTVAQATGGSGSDTLKNVENLTGSNFADTLTGSTGNNTLNGGTGNDILNGGAGNDVLIGGLGADQLTGGTGADRFDFNLLTETGLTSITWDTITDFKTSEGDKIDLLTIDANTALAGDQAFTFLGAVSTFTGDSTGKLRFDAATHILYGSTDADTAAEFAIVLTGVSSLAGTDLVL